MKKINILQSSDVSNVGNVSNVGKVVEAPKTNTITPVKEIQTLKVPELQRNNRSIDEMKLPEVKAEEHINNSKLANLSNDYIPRLVDRSIKLPIAKISPNYQKVKALIKEHIEYSGLELEFHKLALSKDHVEAAIYYLRNISE